MNTEKFDYLILKMSKVHDLCVIILRYKLKMKMQMNRKQYENEDDPP